MPLLRQTWTLVVKNLLIALVRHPISTPFRAFVLPVVFIVFLSYAKSLFIPASVYGISEPHDVRSLSQAISAVGGGRNKLVFVNNGYEGGEIDAIISNVTAPIESTDIHILKLQQEVDLLTECKNTIIGTSTCIAAAVFYSSPSEGNGGIWNYSLRGDGSLQTKILTDSNNNDAQIYVLPLQHAIDSAISQSGISGAKSLPTVVENYPYTSLTAAQRRTQIRTRYMGGIIDILGIAFYIGMVGVSYQLTGLIAQEREIGMAQLLDSMMPNRARWQPQAIRILANHLAFDLIYLPGWVIMSVVLCAGVFTQTNPAIILFTNIFAGLSTSSLSVFGAGFFRKAQLSGISTVIIFLLLAVLAQVVNKAGTASVAVLSLLFPPMNYTFLIITIARWERQDLGTNLIKAAPENTSALPAIVFWIFMIIQIVVYPILGAWVERLLYGTASKARKTRTEASDAAVTLVGFTKVYKPRWMQRLSQFVLRRPTKTVLAVNDLNFSARRGEIMVYLGANGSGKSTTLDAIAGLTEITAGEIQIDFSENNTSLGVCPQKNVLWQHLTVYEHVRIFNKIKSGAAVASKGEILELLKACDIDFKQKAKSATLSGGQKRKLQLAMMFTGGSTVCLVDEVSSGLDPLSRRKIWDILLSERGRRSIILTTHFLDEADLLADHIAILSKGQLRAYGTSVQLKHDMGNGYRVHVFHREGEKSVHVYDKPHVAQDDQVMYLMSSSQEAARFISQLESDGLMEYQVSGPTIEDVFLKLADEAKGASDEEIKGAQVNTTSRSPSPADEENKDGHVVTMAAGGPNAVPELLTGKRMGMWHQAAVLFWKRMIVTRRNPLPSIAAFLIPVVAAGLTTLFLPGYELPGCSPISLVSISDIYTLSSDYTYQLVGGPPSLLTQQALQAYADTLPNSNGNGTGNLTQLYNSVILVDSLDDFNREINTQFANVTPGGFFLGSNGQPSTFAWKGNADISGAQIVQNMLDTLLTNIPISSRYQSFDVPWPIDAGQALQMITYFGLAMAVYPSFLALYPTLERLRNVRQLYYSNGVRAMPLWLAYTSFDFVLVLAISACATIIFAAVTGIWYHIGYLFVVFFLYGLASTLLSYVISLFSKSQLAAFAFAAAGQAVIFLLYFIAFMSILTYVGAAEQHHVINIAHFTIAIISPIANLTRALFISLNIFALTCHGEELASNPGDMTVYGGPILYLLMQSLILFCVLLWWESGSLWRRLRRKKQPEEVEINSTFDADVSNELTRVASSRDGLRVLRLTKQFKKNLAVDDVTFGVPRGEVFALLGPNGAGKSTVISLIRGDLQPSRRGGDIFVEDVSVISHRAQARSRLGVCPQFDAMDTMTVAEHLHFYARIRGVSNPKHNAVAVMQAVGLTAYSERMAAKLSGGNKRKLSLGIALMGNPSVLLLDEPSSGMDAASKRVMWRTLASVVPGRSLVLTTHSMEEADALANRAGIMASNMLALGTTDYLRRKHGDSYYVHLVHSQSPHTPDADMEKIRDWIRVQFPNATVEDKTYHGQVRFSVPVSSSPTEQTPDPKDGTEIAVEKVYSNDMDDSKITTIDEKAPNVALSKSISSSKTTISGLFAALETAKSELDIEYYNLSRATLDQVFLSIVNKHNVREDRGHAE